LIGPPIESGVEERNDQEDEEDKTFLLERLKALQVAEQALAKEQRVAKLKRAIADAEERLSSLQKPPATLPPSASAVSSTMLGNMEPANMTSTGLPRTPLDDLLAGERSSSLKVPNTNQESATASMNSVFAPLVDSGLGGQASDGPLAAPHAVQESLMFLKPAQMAKGERVLCIVDFIDKLVPTTDERTISEVGLTKLLVSYGPKKPKLDSVSLAQWVIGNTRIFHTLVQLGKLPSSADVQHYLAYTVKIMELSSRFTWASVLRYDDEFRHLQAIYNYPWSYDSPHLHTVILEPVSSPTPTKPPSPKPSSLTSTLANVTPEGRIIYRNFNRVKGCTLFDCNFAHVCSRKVNGKACAQSHPLYSHQGGPKSAVSPPSPPAGPQ